MPEPWPSIRSTARWVLPVLVGPRIAVTRDGAMPADRSLMTRPRWRTPPACTSGTGRKKAEARNGKRNLTAPWNTGETNHDRIGDVHRFRLCSLLGIVA